MNKLIPCMKCNVTRNIDLFYPCNIRKRTNTGECKACARIRIRASQKEPHRLAYYASEEGKKAAIKNFNNYVAKYPNRYAVRLATRNAIRRGDLVRALTCECCNQVVKIEAHHDDYNKSLEVRWLCIACHNHWHNHNTPTYQTH